MGLPIPDRSGSRYPTDKPETVMDASYGGSFATNVVLPKEAIELLVNVEAPCPFSPTVHCPPATALDTAPGARTCARPLCAL